MSKRKLCPCSPRNFWQRVRKGRLGDQRGGVGRLHPRVLAWQRTQPRSPPSRQLQRLKLDAQHRRGSSREASGAEPVVPADSQRMPVVPYVSLGDTVRGHCTTTTGLLDRPLSNTVHSHYRTEGQTCAIATRLSILHHSFVRLI